MTISTEFTSLCMSMTAQDLRETRNTRSKRQASEPLFTPLFNQSMSCGDTRIAGFLCVTVVVLRFSYAPPSSFRLPICVEYAFRKDGLAPSKHALPF